MSRYGIELLKAGWYFTDCAPRRVALKAGKWTGLSLTAVVVFLVVLGMLTPTEWKLAG